jgi:hypothetical protein
MATEVKHNRRRNDPQFINPPPSGFMLIGLFVLTVATIIWMLH